MPLRVNYAGVMPIIFAGAILSFPQQLASKIGQIWDVPFLTAIARHLTEGAILYLTVYGVLILFFSYFWVATQFNELQIADDLKKNGGYIPGVRPGQATSDYLHHAMTRITLAGAIYLAFIALLPQWMISGFKVAPIPFIGEWLDANLPRAITEGMNVPYYFGGTSLLIVVGVAMDTVQQVESQLIMRHYDGFMKKARIRGRRA